MSKLERIIAHWSVTDYKADESCKRHYHFIFEGDGTEVLGRLRPEANENIADGIYCGHTLNCNQGSIGVACAAMWAPEGYKQTVDDPGPKPVTKPQFEAMCRRITQLCKKYNIPVTKKTVLMHGEVQKNLGIKQRGKWDIAVLPYAGLKTIEECGDYMRKLVSENPAKL